MKKAIIYRGGKLNKEFYFVLKSKNGKITATGETCKRKGSVLTTLKNNFPAFKVVDLTHL